VTHSTQSRVCGLHLTSRSRVAARLGCGWIDGNPPLSRPPPISLRRTAACHPLTRLTIALVLSSLSACASVPAGSKPDPRDRFERFNRAVYKFNNALDHAILRPVARGYVKVTPRPVRTGVSNFLGNLEYTKTIGNDLFQARFTDFGFDIRRLIVNTTLGVGGLFDPATRFGLEKHDRDFGQTLGKWGLPTGPYLVLPLLGPSDIRDAAGLVPDHFMSIDHLINNQAVELGLGAVRLVDRRAQVLSLDATLDSAFDPYGLVRSVWFQRRDYKVHGDRPPPEEPLPPDEPPSPEEPRPDSDSE
jgi:phospholipid-binding lipoprotein MlaA